MNYICDHAESCHLNGICGDSTPHINDEYCGICIDFPDAKCVPLKETELMTGRNTDYIHHYSDTAAELERELAATSGDDIAKRLELQARLDVVIEREAKHVSAADVLAWLETHCTTMRRVAGKRRIWWIDDNGFSHDHDGTTVAGAVKAAMEATK